MALPRINTPTYEFTLPSTQEKIKYRPFLVKEEKVLLLAMESEDETQINNSVIDIVRECTFGVVDGMKAPTYDMEYAFLRVRAKSVGETVELQVTAPDDGVTKVPYKLNLEDVNVQMTLGHENTIKLDDEITVTMKHPTMGMISAGTESGSETESIFAMISLCVESITFGNDTYNRVDITKEEINTFIGDMSQDMFQKIQDFFDTMPKLRHVIEFTNPKTKKKNEMLLEGLGDFFT